MRLKASLRDPPNSSAAAPRPGQAQALLDELTQLQVDTRRAWGSPWFVLECFGLVTVIAAGALVALGSVALLVTWAVAGAAALGAIGRHYRRRARRDGIALGRGQAWRWSVSAFVVCFAAAFTAGRQAHGRDAAIVASVLVVVACYLAWGRWQRRADAAFAVSVAAVPALVLAAASAVPWLVELSFGVALGGAGLALRAIEERA